MGRSWISQQAVISDVFTAVTSLSLAAAGPKRGEHVIDVGCGTGDTLLALAKIVGPSGAVLGVDVSAAMLDFARDRSTGAELGNVTCALADATTYGFEPGWADLVYSRFGVMFFDNAVKAFANIRSGMKEDGRLVFVCFRTLPESPWFHVPIEAARPHVPPQPPADPTAPGMFSFANKDRLHGVLAEAGFHDIVLDATDVPFHGRDVAQSMAFITQAGPLPALLEKASDKQRARAIEAVRNALAAKLGADGRGLHVGLWLVSASASQAA
ncbi:class I SAM-dependent methyltransferase [Bradyrhizobium tropiciagri]|uniref:class I SAM-dependent methyltransferase n=1 Tax=Bradyrhizobium tropiciagri TaxID=312253 RepID=UPI001BA9B07B|nr:class I SAM-dependent methyltransferase [Bradyrhizobium tropiciagri]MBR0875316.1 class I SAM-dependent methyltransferase [Bradyrhizobium tropiciagri]